MFISIYVHQHYCTVPTCLTALKFQEQGPHNHCSELVYNQCSGSAPHGSALVLVCVLDVLFEELKAFVA
jgi:hypothetical protein